MMLKKRWLLIILIGFLAVCISACGGPDEHIWLKSPGWSRAVFLGETAFSDPVPVALNETGDMYFVLVERNNESESSHFLARAFDRNANALWDHALTGVPLQLPTSIQMLWVDDALQLFWIDHEQLYMLGLDSNGNTLNDDPVLLSGDAVVDSFSVVTNPDGEPVLWYAGSRETPGIFGLTSFDGSSSPVEIDPDGIRIQLRYDQSGTLHAAWLHYPVGYGTSEIIYAAYPQGTDWQPGQYSVVHELSVSPTSSLTGPALGVDGDETYLFWTVTVRAGLQAGAIQTEYIHFSHAQPSDIAPPQSIAMPSAYTLDHELLPDAQLNAGERVSLQDANVPMTTALEEITTNPTGAGELAIAFRTPTQHLWRKERFQVNVAYFRNGNPSSYQPLSFTPTLSTKPNLFSSTDSYLYITWLEKQETDWYNVYFASTSPDVKDALSRSTGREFLRVFAQVSFGMLVGILLAPIGATLWAIAPLAVLLITAPLRNLGSSRLRGIFTVISIIGAVVAFWMGKLATLPGMLEYVPFSTWIPDIPFVLGNILRWLVPLLITGIALGVAWYYTFRRSNQSTLYFLLIYVGIDTLLTAAIYAVLIYGAI